MNTYGEQVLLVEDDIHVAAILRELIKARGHGNFFVQHATTLSAALKKLEDKALTLVLTDLNLDDSSGFDTFDAIHRLRPDIPIIILSGLGNEDLAIEAVRRGAQDYLMKGQVDGDTIIRAFMYAIERKRLQQEWSRLLSIREQESRLEALGTMATGIAHEINTPLQFIGTNIAFINRTFAAVRNILDNCSRLIECTGPGNEFDSLMESLKSGLNQSSFKYMISEIDEVLRETSNGITRLHSIVKAMSIFSRNAGGRRVMYNINRAVRDAILVSRSEWKDTADVQTSLEDKLPEVNCIPEEISQAILNLIVNAAQAVSVIAKEKIKEGISERGLIEISTKASGSRVEISIADSGHGMTPEVQSRIFDPFFTTKDIGQGTGQGLTYARHIIVKKHGGTIDVSSTPGCGSVFRITLPLNTPESPGQDSDEFISNADEYPCRVPCAEHHREYSRDT